MAASSPDHKKCSHGEDLPQGFMPFEGLRRKVRSTRGEGFEICRGGWKKSDKLPFVWDHVPDPFGRFAIQEDMLKGFGVSTETVVRNGLGVASSSYISSEEGVSGYQPCQIFVLARNRCFPKGPVGWLPVARGGLKAVPMGLTFRGGWGFEPQQTLTNFGGLQRSSITISNQYLARQFPSV